MTKASSMHDNSPFWSSKRVLVTGASGFLGRHTVGALARRSCHEVVAIRKSDCDLTNESQVARLFKDVRPNIVIHLAGLVGGIAANRSHPADFFLRNLLMGTFTLHHAYLSGAEKVIAAGAGCGYPEHAPLPLRESSFWDGFPQEDSAPYSLAKRMLHVQSIAYWKQYRFPAVVAIPGNVYGPHDNFDLEMAHVVPALVRKFTDATDSRLREVEIWGTGEATRDFVYAGDVAEGMLRAAEVCQQPGIFNISRGEETSIRRIVSILRDVTGFAGDIRWNTARPEGQARRLFDTSAARDRLGFNAATSIEEGLAATVRWYRENRHVARTRDPLMDNVSGLQPVSQ